jgi:hypothetical protein
MSGAGNLGSRRLALKKSQPKLTLLRLAGETFEEKKERLAKENAEWAARCGPVTTKKVPA